MKRLTTYCCLAATLRQAVCYTPSIGQKNYHRQQQQHHLQSRRTTLAKIISSPLLITTIIPLPFISSAANAAEEEDRPQKKVSDSDADVQILIEATEALTSLLENWKKATIDCTYADVPRELLETKNKEQLLEKASTFALFDKSTSIVSCKRTTRIVRDYIGDTGIGPLLGAEKRLLRSNVVDRVDPDSLDDYFSAVELFTQSISRATSLTYMARRDFDSMNNFIEGEEADGGNLEAARKAIDDANVSLKKAVSLMIM